MASRGGEADLLHRCLLVRHSRVQPDRRRAEGEAWRWTAMRNARVRCSVAATLTRSVHGALRPVCRRRGAARLLANGWRTAEKYFGSYK